MGILEGKVAIIIGASSGVGYGCTLRYTQEGANVIAAARRLPKLETLKEDCAKHGFPGEVIPVQCDVGNEEDLDKVVATAIEKYGKIDILACIAQSNLNAQYSFEETDYENLVSTFTGGAGYTFQMVKKCLPYMKEAGFGRILTCASGAGLRYTPHTCAYGMAKAAIVNLTHTLAQELGHYGITTNCFCPVSTNEFFENEGTNDSAIPIPIMQMLSPVGRMGDPYNDVSPILAFLASDLGGYINAEVIEVCGGIGITSPATVLEGLAKMQQSQ